MSRFACLKTAQIWAERTPSANDPMSRRAGLPVDRLLADVLLPVET